MLTAYGMLSAGYNQNACEIYKASDAGQQSIQAGALINCLPPTQKVVYVPEPTRPGREVPRYTQEQVDQIVRKVVSK